MTIKRLQYRIKDGETDLNADTFNSRFYDIDSRLHALETVSITWQDAVSELQQFGLARINGALSPVLEQAQDMVSALQEQQEAWQAWWDAEKIVVENLHAAQLAELVAAGNAQVAEATSQAVQAGEYAAILQANMGRLLAVNMSGLSAVSLDVSAHDVFELSSIDTNFTLHLANMTGGNTISIFIANGSGRVTWADTIKWQGEVAPTLSAKIDVVILSMLSSTIIGSYAIDHG